MPTLNSGMGKGKGTVATRRRRACRKLVSTLLLAISLALCVYPAVASVLMSWRQHDVASSMLSVADESDDDERLAQLADARAYNASLAPDGGWADNSFGLAGGASGAEDIAATELPPEAKDYGQQLTWKGPDPIAVIEIPKIATRMAVYHGTSDEALASGAGHLDFTSLPVGGLSSHCGISAHSGVKTARMFDDLRILEVGDVFNLYTLGDAYSYRVYLIEDMVRPEEAQEHLQVTAGRDLCSLVTCTPYGVNSHRLIVHGERIKYDPAAEDMEWNASRQYVNGLTMPLIVAVAIATALWSLMLLGIVRHGRRRKARSRGESTGKDPS